VSAPDRQLQVEQDLRELVRLPAGRRFLWALIDERADLTTTTFCGADTHRSAYLEGRRSIGVDLVNQLRRVAPSDYVHMVGEAVSRREMEALAQETARGG
jgi:hypothetical protein